MRSGACKLWQGDHLQTAQVSEEFTDRYWQLFQLSAGRLVDLRDVTAGPARKQWTTITRYVPTAKKLPNLPVGRFLPQCNIYPVRMKNYHFVKTPCAGSV